MQPLQRVWTDELVLLVQQKLIRRLAEVSHHESAQPLGLCADSRGSAKSFAVNGERDQRCQRPRLAVSPLKLGFGQNVPPSGPANSFSCRLMRPVLVPFEGTSRLGRLKRMEPEPETCTSTLSLFLVSLRLPILRLLPTRPLPPCLSPLRTPAIRRSDNSHPDSSGQSMLRRRRQSS